MNLGTSIAILVLYFLIAAGALCILTLLRGLIKSPPGIHLKTDNRYALLQKHFGSSNEVKEYIESHRSRPPMYKQVYWMNLDGWGAYTLIPAPNDSIL